MVMVVVASTSVLGESQCMYVCVLAPVSFTRSVSMSYHCTDCSTTEGLVPPFYFNLLETPDGNECACCQTCTPRYDVDWATFVGLKDAATMSPTMLPTASPTTAAPTQARYDV